MKYTLYHKTLPVIEFELNRDGYVTKIYEIKNPAHIPVQFFENCKIPEHDDYYALYDKILRWMIERGIPSSRKNLKSVLSILDVNSSDELAKRSFYLSLSDQYWCAPTEHNLDWNDINFFTNNFSDDIGALLLDRKPNRISSDRYHSPNNTSQGNLSKKWVIRNKKRIMVKGGSGTEQLEPLNEVLASEIFRRLGMNHVHYDFKPRERKHFCVCENFVTKDTELITVYELCADKASGWNDEISLSDIEDRCRIYKIPFSLVDLGKMFAVDFLIANTDRHTNNFGFLRNANTLEWIGLAPIFDSGTCMFMDKQYFELEKNGMDSRFINSKPFIANQLEQLKLFPLEEISKTMDLNNLDGIGDYYKNLLNQNKRELDSRKIEALSSVLVERVKELKRILRQN